MKQLFMIQQQHPRLLLFFAGWGMDEHPFKGIHPQECDWMICYDYRSLEFNKELLKPYESITLVAWSMGVWVASYCLNDSPQLPIRERIALLGTSYPIDDEKGIPHAIFEGSLKNLNERNLQKFMRRMCGSSEAYRDFMQQPPQRTINELKEELVAIRQYYHIYGSPAFPWNTAIIGEKDQIFPPQNQQRGWDAFGILTYTYPISHYDERLFTSILTTCNFHEA